MANKETATHYGTLLMTVLPELDSASVVSSEPLGQDGYIFTLNAGDTEVSVVAYDDTPETLFELDDIPRNEKGESPFHVLREISTVDRMALRWPNTIRAIVNNDVETYAVISACPDWNGDPFEFVRSDLHEIRIMRLGRYEAASDDPTSDPWECVAIDLAHNPDVYVRQTRKTATEAILSVVIRIARNRIAASQMQQKLAGLDNLSPSA